MVHCHPCPDSLGAALRDAVLDGLGTAGATTHLINLYEEGFGPGADATVVAQHKAQLLACDRLVLVYPTWWGAQPAMLRSWFEQVWWQPAAQDAARSTGDNARRYRNITRLTAVTTHGSPKWINAVQGESGKHFLQRRLRRSLGRRARVEWMALYDLDHEKPGDTDRFLVRVRERCARTG